MAENIYKFILNLFSSLTSVLKTLLRSSYLNKIKANPANQSVIILGTGPSFKTTIENHLAELLSHDTIGLNHFAEKEEFSLIKPKHYVIGAPELWNDKLDQKYLDRSKKLFTALAENTHWPMQLFIGISGKGFSMLKLFDGHKNITVKYYNRTAVEGNNFIRHKMFDWQLGMPRPHNVMIPSIMISLWLGYKKIILVGADHSWHEQIKVDDANNVLLDQKHYFSKKENWKPMHYAGQRSRLMHEVFEKLTLAFKGYHIINNYASKRNVEIINASEKSYIDAFSRTSF